MRPSSKPLPKPVSTSQQQPLRQAPAQPQFRRPTTGKQPNAQSMQGQAPKRPSAPVSAPAEGDQRKAAAPKNIEELIPALVRYSIRQAQGIGISDFDQSLLPRVKNLLPDAARGDEALSGPFMDLAHAIYLAVVCGQFRDRPVLCGVRATELAADLVERVLARIGELEDERFRTIRCKNLLTGLTLQSVRLLEVTNLEHESLKGFTDNYERAVIISYGLKTQAEATGLAPWVGLKDNPLDKRIGATINTMSNVFGDYIAKHSQDLSEEVNQSVLAEFDGFMERFAPYIDSGHTSTEKKTKAVTGRVTGSEKPSGKVEPLEIKELRTRPAGVEIKLADGRVLFVSHTDARKIGKAADGEVDDTAKREREALEGRKATNPEADAARSIEKGDSRQQPRERIEQRQNKQASAPVRAPLPRPKAR